MIPLLAALRITSAIAGEVGLVLLVHGDGDEFERLRVGLAEEGEGVVDRQIAPAFAEFGFHVFDQEVELLDVARDRARNDGGWFD